MNRLVRFASQPLESTCSPFNSYDRDSRSTESLTFTASSRSCLIPKPVWKTPDFLNSLYGNRLFCQLGHCTSLDSPFLTLNAHSDRFIPLVNSQKLVASLQLRVVRQYTFYILIRSLWEYITRCVHRSRVPGTLGQQTGMACKLVTLVTQINVYTDNHNSMFSESIFYSPKRLVFQLFHKAIICYKRKNINETNILSTRLLLIRMNADVSLTRIDIFVCSCSRRYSCLCVPALQHGISP